MTPRAFVAAVVGLGLLLVAAACGGDPTATPVPEQPPAVDSPRIAALKAASEAKGLRFLTHDEIVAGAMREGALVAVPGFDDITFPELKEAFEAAYPYIDLRIEIVSGTEAGERLNFAMLAGRADVDVIEASSSDWPLYAANDLLLPYDYRAMAEAGELAVSPEAISDTVAGQLPFFASGIDAIAYNTDLVSEEDAPTGWDSCIDPKWAGKVATDTSTALSGLLGAWTEDEIIAYAKAMKDNDVIFVRGVTATLVRLLSGEFHIMCPTNYHGALRQLIADPDAPMKIVLPDPLSIGPREQEGIYAGAKHPNAALLWMEFVSTPVVQLEILSAHDPGKGPRTSSRARCRMSSCGPSRARSPSAQATARCARPRSMPGSSSRPGGSHGWARRLSRPRWGRTVPCLVRSPRGFGGWGGGARRETSVGPQACVPCPHVCS